MFLEVQIPKELVNWQTKQDEQVKVKPTRKAGVWGTQNSKARLKKAKLKTPLDLWATAGPSVSVNEHKDARSLSR